MQCEIGDYQYQCTYDSSIYYTKKFTNHQISLLEQEKKFDKEGQVDEQDSLILWVGHCFVLVSRTRVSQRTLTTREDP